MPRVSAYPTITRSRSIGVPRARRESRPTKPHFDAMVTEMRRILRPGGTLFARLASTIGLPADASRPLDARRFVLPDGSERFLVDEHTLITTTQRFGGVLLDPIKTTVVQKARSTTTWVVRRSS